MSDGIGSFAASLPDLPQLASTDPSAYVGAPSATAATATGSIPDRFVGALQQGGLTNPAGLGAVAAYAQHESGYSPSSITGSWSDPSQSGQPGTSGGILSWRGDRLDAMKAYTAGAADPVTAQAKFLLQENPQLTQNLQNAQSPAEANDLMAKAWKFAGYNSPGGEYASRLATTQDFANKLSNGASVGATAQRGAFGLGGAVGQGSAVPGQSSPTPSLASMANASSGVQPQSQTDLLQSLLNGGPSALGAAAKAQQQKQQGQQKSSGMQLGQPYRPQAIGLQQAQQMFDPSRFYSALRSAGVRNI